MSTAQDWSAYDRPELRGALGIPAGDAFEVMIALDGMHCGGCAARAERLLAGTVERTQVNVPARTLRFRWHPERVPISKILRQLDEAGLDPRLLVQENGSACDSRQERRTLLRLGIATICAMQVMMLAWPSYSHAVIDPGVTQLLRWTQWIIATPGVFWAGWTFFSGASSALRARVANMDVTVALALAVAYAASAARVLEGHGDLYFDTATMFVWLLLIGRFLEGRTRHVAGQRLRLLAGRRALFARRRDADGVETVPITSLRRDDEVIVAAGEALPADGRLLDVAAELDESLLTGESRPVAHRRGDSLMAGSLNIGNGAITARVTRTGSETTLAQITGLLDGAQQQKPAVQRLADRIAGHFVLAIIAFAMIGFAWMLPQGVDAALSAALAVLVASCPCALSLAVPIVLAAASSRLAEGGVLVANADALLRLTDIDTVLFDKTGTLTHARLSLRASRALADLPAARCLNLAAALERSSHHPIAEAFRDHATRLQAEDLHLLEGGGIEGRIDGRRYWLGAAERMPVPVEPLPTQDEALTWIVLADATRALACFALEAQPRPEAATALAELAALGLEAEVLSGDSAEATAALARTLGLARHRARQSPQDKLARLGALRAAGARVLAVGDGFNDAPLLAAADVSVAMPEGSAMTQARADVLLVGDSLAGLPLAIRVAQSARRRMRENLLWALIYNAAVLPLAISGALVPWMAAAGMSLSSLLVALNALRLDRIDKHRAGAAADAGEPSEATS